MRQARLSISRWLALGLALCLPWGTAWAGRAARLRFLGTDFTVYWVDPASEELSLFWQDPAGKPFQSFSRLREHLQARSQELQFAINAGIFGTDGAPLGLHVENSKVLRPLNLGELEGGQWNFYLKPNGVFYLEDRQPAIVESARFGQLQVRPRLACQSGPLLLAKGQIHPAFRAGSTNFRTRSGVGVTTNRLVVFAISDQALRFHDFARLFQEQLGCDDALYLDGEICAVCLPALGYKAEAGNVRFAGMFAVTAPLPTRSPLPKGKVLPALVK